jgi:hypothetical protein
MKLLQQSLFVLLMCIGSTAQAISPDVQKDLLLSKITTLLKADKPAEALPYFAELEKMESSLPKQLPESFHYYYIQSLDKAGNADKALGRADVYLKRYGQLGKNYGNVIAIMSRLQIQAARLEEERITEATRQAEKAAEDKRECRERYKNDIRSAHNNLQHTEAACRRSTYPGNSFCYGDNRDGRDRQRADAHYAAKEKMDDLDNYPPACMR